MRGTVTFRVYGDNAKGVYDAALARWAAFAGDSAESLPRETEIIVTYEPTTKSWAGDVTVMWKSDKAST